MARKSNPQKRPQTLDDCIEAVGLLRADYPEGDHWESIRRDHQRFFKLYGDIVNRDHNERVRELIEANSREG